MQRKLAAIIAGDVVGYSRLMAEDEAQTYSELRAALREIVEPAVQRHGGRTFKYTGDGFLTAFGSVNAALEAAIDIQRGFGTCPLDLRLGLNLGDVIEEDGDIFGDGVNVANRLQAMAEPGTIYASASVVRSADKEHVARFRRIGRRQAKNIPEAIEVYAMHPDKAAPNGLARLLPARRLSWSRPRPTVLASICAGILVTGFIAAGSWTERAAAPPAAGSTSGSLRATAADSRPTVAVLPFDDLSAEPSQTYFADGLTEDVIANLARNRELMVIARNSTFALGDQPADIREIGERLGAQYVVEGSARRAGDQLRVVAQLIDARSGTHLWSHSYDQRIEDVFAVQADLTARIVSSLVSYVRQSEAAAAVARPTADLRAYDLVLRARGHHKHGGADRAALLEARDLYGRAVELDPRYATARAYLGLTYISEQFGWPTADAAELVARGLAEAREAIRLEPDLPLAYQVLSFGLAASGEYEGSMRAAQRAVELNGSDPDSLMALAKAQLRFGAYDEAVENAERARRLHPLAPEYYAYIHGQALYAAGRLEEADEVLAECTLRAPQDPDCLKIRAAVLVGLERPDEARAAMTELLRREPDFSLAGEEVGRRFGNSPLMRRFLSDLSRAEAPPSAA
ncbi:adenylate/guanylate cyclase domain-containing protein [Geminicoccus harenae]|uniref:adenylate/guanylate cyclase domain-containing protein n=3 Tax=Geminicoccus harenae TaxID=2498453 RepID=UPI001C9784E7|nr:adenylate/guanylate cyclase domain-containing protein [Geminicoccus harenae]